jgi:hypothetical protein
MNIQEQEELDFYRDSIGTVDRFDTELHAYNSGDTTHQWILSDRDCWYKNPFYVGPDQPHPESYHNDLTDEEYEQMKREEEYDRYEVAQLQRLDEIHDGDWDEIPF